MKYIYAAAVVVASFFGTLWIIDTFWPAPCANGIELKPPFKKLTNQLAFVAPAPSLDRYADRPEKPEQSKALLCENGSPLGPPHTAHLFIERDGGGRFSHYWGLGFIFSTSDNSDPNTNGKTYTAIPPR
jgi:hypothetical protein